MNKVAIVGVEGSGKTVMLACLGELYTSPDEAGYFLRPKNFQTASYVMDRIARMRGGAWPTATADDAMQGLDWMLCRKREEGGRPHDVCEISFLDFGGEVYRAAFGINDAVREDLTNEVTELRRYLTTADQLVVLINLRDVIAKGDTDKRVQESVWITNAILSSVFDQANPKARTPKVSIAITQADSYADTISQCGGAKGVLARYLPHVSNSYDWLDIYDVTAVDRTVLDNDGNIVPAPDFTPAGLRPLMRWIVGSLSDKGRSSAKDSSRNKARMSQARESSAGDATQHAVEVKKGGGYFAAPGKTFDYHGRSGRKEFWRFWGVTTALLFLSVLLAGSSNSGDQEAGAIITGLIALGSVLPGFSLSVRRFHDVGITGWVLLLVFIPYVGWLIPFAVGFVKGQDKTNRYGDPV